MCGVCASSPSDPGFMGCALRVQLARGPDETKLEDLGFASLGINRLAVSGLRGGSQPLRSADGSVTVVFNGAIYNVAQLQKEFGLVLPSQNDGEVIAPLYQHLGLKFADYLEGMFSICIADSREKKLVIAVDPIGIKPLYYTRGENGAMLVASDVRSFPDSLRRLTRRLPPGTLLTSDGEWHRVSRAYWQDGALAELIRSSVQEQIPMEVEWGCMLSGGVDSSLIVQFASEACKSVQTITCGLRGGTDVLAGRRMAEHVCSEHHEVFVEQDELPALVESVVDATASMEPWTIMGGVGTYLVAREARRLGMKVLLSGEGADELFGGYDEFQQVPGVFLDGVLSQYQADLGVTECLRLDRCTMAHSVEARVPFLSTSVIRHARALPHREKILRSRSETVRKHALRMAAAQVMPKEFAYRAKEEFSHGSGISSAIHKIAADRYPQSRLQELAARFPSFGLRSPSHAWFFEEWLRLFGDSIGLDWSDLLDRGLYRQSVSFYVPRGADSFLYNTR
jgi:asparagine synthase (glutamine-hydrolysing)